MVADVMHKQFWSVCSSSSCAYVGVLQTAPGVTDPAEGTRDMGLFLFHARLFSIHHIKVHVD